MTPVQFATARLSVHDWRPVIEDEVARRALERSLSTILSARVLEHLPPSLQLNERAGGMAAWMDERAAESDVLLVDRKDSGETVGLLILATDPGASSIPAAHVGYLLSEDSWGRGLASELLQGLVLAVSHDGPVRLLGGVDKLNPASARVLQKAGFVFEPELSTPDTDMYVLNTG